MHYHAQVWVRDNSRIEDQVEYWMAPHKEAYEPTGSDESHSRGFWDWYQIGGRYSGRATGYDPETDPANIEVCNLCGGTGFRNDTLGQSERAENPSYTCNGCGSFDQQTGKWSHGKHGAGRRIKWPTQWAPMLECNVTPVANVTDDLKCYTLIVRDKVMHKENWDGNDFVPGALGDKTVKQALSDLGVKDGYLVTIDYHC